MFKLFTVAAGRVEEGIRAERLKIGSAGVVIPAVTVGEEGRNRSRGVIRVDLWPATQTTLDDEGSATIKYAALAHNSNGSPLLVEMDHAADSEFHCVVALRTPIGFRGGNMHTGDEAEGDDLFRTEPGYRPFPGECLAHGVIAQGDAGRMGSGNQFVMKIKSGIVFRTAYTGRLYGAPDEHFYMYRDGKMLCLTREERIFSELF